MIYTVFKREYLNIVRKKSFWFGILLFPLFIGFFAGIQAIALIYTEEEAYTFLIPGIDTPEMFQALESADTEKVHFHWKADFDLKNLMDSLSNKVAILELPPMQEIDKDDPSLIFRIHSKENISILLQEAVEDKLEGIIEQHKLQQAGLSQEDLDKLAFNLRGQTVKDGKTSNPFIASAAGYVMGFLMYLLLTIFGSILMQGVIEEKTNRIVEIIVSSIKPFHFMMGKVTALAAAGLTQFLLLAFLSGGSLLTVSIITGSVMQPSAVEIPNTPEVAAGSDMIMGELQGTIESFNWNILWLFPIYFIGGFLLYGSLMAAAGAAVDNIQDAQQFTTPIVLLMVIPFVLMFSIIQNPNTGLAVFGSIFPFFSPIVMMARMGITSVPWYQILLSVVFLAGTILGCIWVAAKIYRIGILMYGKKPSFKEVFRWLRYS